MNTLAIYVMLLLSILGQETAGKPSRGLVGFQLGQTLEEARKVSALEKGDTSGTRTLYTVKELKHAPTMLKSGILVFCNGILVKVVLSTDPTKGDYAGMTGRAEFSELQKVLGSKYTVVPELTLMEIGRKVYTAPEEFYECLSFPGCGLWLAGFKGPDREILLRIRGHSSGTGMVTLEVEAVPEFKACLAAEEEQNRRKAEDAL
jgi:hypothetical protein